MDNEKLLAAHWFEKREDGTYERSLSNGTVLSLSEEQAVELSQAEEHVKETLWSEGEPDVKPFGFSMSAKEKETL